MKLKLLLLIGLIIIMTSCTVQKRLHRSGYYVHLNKKHSGEGKSPAINKVINIENLLTAKKNDFKTQAAPSKVLSHRKAIDVCGDTICLIDGTKILCKVIEIGENEIEYKQCDNLNEKVYILKRELINKISFSNGTHEMINPLEEDESINNEPEISNEKVDCGDTLFLKNGKIIACTIVESKKSYIQYKTCDSLNKASYYIERKNLKRTTKNVYVKPKPKTVLPEETNESEKINHPLALASFFVSLATIIMALIAIGTLAFNVAFIAFILSILSAVLGLVSLTIIKKKSQKYKGSGFSIFAMSTPIILILAIIIIAISSI